MLAGYASDPRQSKGRVYKEDSISHRDEFQRDRDRIIHSNAFKRLQYKTQVFVNHQGDHYRNRLTHSLEVATISRSLAKSLNLSEELTESIALSHDLGHTPFGHSGEDALKVCMKQYGGFCHNAQVIKILTYLEKRYSDFDGLNLTWELIEGVAKHNGPLFDEIPMPIKQYNQVIDIYIDGKLASSCVLKGFPMMKEEDVVICPDGGFDGSISRVSFYNSAITQDMAFQIYKDGAVYADTFFNNIPGYVYVMVFLLIIVLLAYSLML